MGSNPGGNCGLRLGHVFACWIGRIRNSTLKKGFKAIPSDTYVSDVWYLLYVVSPDFSSFSFYFFAYFVGKLTKIRIWHDNKYMRAGWFLSSVEIFDEKENQTYLFPCERWLATDEDDGSLVRELSCAKRDVPARSKESLSATGL